MKLSIAEIITATSRMETDEEQVTWLKKNDSVTIRVILKFWYDERVEFLLPNTVPPYKPLEHNNHGILYGKTKMLPLFVKDGTGSGLSQMRREMKFIELLQTVHAEDAKILCGMISKEPLPYLSKKVVQEAFPEIFE